MHKASKDVNVIKGPSEKREDKTPLQARFVLKLLTKSDNPPFLTESLPFYQSLFFMKNLISPTLFATFQRPNPP